MLSVLLVPLRVVAQYEVAAYSQEASYFNNGQPLPAETNLLITGQAPEGVNRIEVSIFKAKTNHKLMRYCIHVSLSLPSIALLQGTQQNAMATEQPP